MSLPETQLRHKALGPGPRGHNPYPSLFRLHCLLLHVPSLVTASNFIIDLPLIPNPSVSTSVGYPHIKCYKQVFWQPSSKQSWERIHQHVHSSIWLVSLHSLSSLQDPHSAVPFFGETRSTNPVTIKGRKTHVHPQMSHNTQPQKLFFRTFQNRTSQSHMTQQFPKYSPRTKPNL